MDKMMKYVENAWKGRYEFMLRLNFATQTTSYK